MMVNDQEEFEQVAGVCWLATGEKESLAMLAAHMDREVSSQHRQSFPQPMPFSQTFPMCCINIRNFVDQFYNFTDGVSQNHLDIDEVLRKVRPQPQMKMLTRSRWTIFSRIMWPSRYLNDYGA